MTGDEIKNARRSLKLTQTEFARLLGCGQSSLSTMEKGKMPVSETIRAAIEELLRNKTVNPVAPNALVSPFDSEKCHHGVVWHPNVHHYYGERLYYFLLRYSKYIVGTPADGQASTTPLEEIHGVLCHVGAFGHCLYEVFGDADILVRVWLDSERYRMLRSELATRYPRVHAIGFSCDTEDYLWAVSQGRWRDITNHEIAAVSKGIEACTKSFGAGVPFDAVAGARKLYDEGFILKFIGQRGANKSAVEARAGIKFFSFLELTQRSVEASQRGLHTASGITNALRAVCDRQEYGISDVSVYLGTTSNKGPGNCLLKGTVDTAKYYNIYRLIVDGLKVLDHEVSPHTFLSAARNWHESDDLAPNPLATNRKAKAILAYAGVGFHEYADLTEHDAVSDVLIEAYDAISPLFNIDVEMILGQFVRGLLGKDARVVLMGSSFLFEIERHMIPYFRFRISESNPGSEFGRFIGQKIDLLTSEATEAEKRGEKNVYRPQSTLTKFTLKEYEVFLAKFCPSEDVKRDLGEDWQRNIEATIEIRNKMAHGRYGDLIKGWAQHMKEIAPAMTIYYALKNWTVSRKAIKE